MISRFSENMTSAMQEALPSNEELKQEILICLKEFCKVRDIIEDRTLPAKNEEGLNVVAGCYNTLEFVAAYWGKRINNAKELLRGNKDVETWLAWHNISSIFYGATYSDFKSMGVVPDFMEEWFDKRDPDWKTKRFLVTQD
jgi:hypothetical protein